MGVIASSLLESAGLWSATKVGVSFTADIPHQLMTLGWTEHNKDEIRESTISVTVDVSRLMRVNDLKLALCRGLRRCTPRRLGIDSINGIFVADDDLLVYLVYEQRPNQLTLRLLPG
jgi:hypothetical protein